MPLPLLPQKWPCLFALAAAILTGSLSLQAAPPGFSPAVPLKCPSPFYPYDLKKANVEGVVVADVMVNTDGRPDQAWPIAYTNHLFASYAVDALKEWTFRPAMEDGHPIAHIARVPVVFLLDSKSPIGRFGNELVRLQTAIDGLFRSIVVHTSGEKVALSALPGPKDRLWFDLTPKKDQVSVSLTTLGNDAEENQMLAYLRQALATHPPSSGFLSFVRLYGEIKVSAPTLRFLRDIGPTQAR